MIDSQRNPTEEHFERANSSAINKTLGQLGSPKAESYGTYDIHRLCSNELGSSNQMKSGQQTLKPNSKALQRGITSN